MSAPVVVSFGGGTNSTAMLIGMVEHGERPEVILFADTGGEKPYIYKHIETFSTWLLWKKFPPITIIRGDAPQMLKDVSLEGECIRIHSLPSIAYGYKKCSLKWKKEPQDKYLRKIGITDHVRCIGFDAGEWHRAKDYPGERYPLIEWNWARDECVKAIDRAGIIQPGKSACFFCPSSRKHEILQLGREYPDLLSRALKMESGAELTHVKGLGRSFAWADVVKAAADQYKLIPDTPIEIDCGCYDGGSE